MKWKINLSYMVVCCHRRDQDLLPLWMLHCDLRDGCESWKEVPCLSGHQHLQASISMRILWNDQGLILKFNDQLFVWLHIYQVADQGWKFSLTLLIFVVLNICVQISCTIWSSKCYRIGSCPMRSMKENKKRALFKPIVEYQVLVVCFLCSLKGILHFPFCLI